MVKKINESKPMRVKYIDCMCHDISDLTRIIYNPDYKSFYFEYKLIRMPGLDDEKWMTNKTLKDKIKNRITRIKSYFINIWYAIKGLPHWHYAHPEYSSKEAKKIAKFILSSLDGKNIGDIWGD